MLARIMGTGTPASRTFAALQTAVVACGSITFNFGKKRHQACLRSAQLLLRAGSLRQLLASLSS